MSPIMYLKYFAVLHQILASMQDLQVLFFFNAPAPSQKQLRMRPIFLKKDNHCHLNTQAFVRKATQFSYAEFF